MPSKFRECGIGVDSIYNYTPTISKASYQNPLNDKSHPPREVDGFLDNNSLPTHLAMTRQDHYESCIVNYLTGLKPSFNDP
ncbi:MAG: hypothetical protein NXH73_00465 [Flavobacteriaceae bacterium]|nr:hypothetical protein [Flavobacteriaceae bacterium]